MMSEHNPLDYKSLVLYHPAYVLKTRVKEAHNLAGVALVNCQFGCCRGTDAKQIHILPTQRALNLAHSSAIGSARWLQYSLRDQAGVYETKLTKVLDTLCSKFYNLVGNPLHDTQKEAWIKNVLELQEIIETIKYVAEDDNDMTKWCGFLGQCRDSLHAIHIGLAQLSIDVKNGNKPKDSIQCPKIKKSLPVFKYSLSIIKHGLLYSYEAVFGYEKWLHDTMMELPDLLSDRFRQTVQWDITQKVELNDPVTNKVCYRAGNLLEILDYAVNNSHNGKSKCSESNINDGEETEDANEVRASLQPAKEKAYRAYEIAESAIGQQITDRQAYEWIEGHPDEVDNKIGDYVLPKTIATYQSQMVDARKHYGKEKYGATINRHTSRSVAPEKSVDYSDLHNTQ